MAGKTQMMVFNAIRRLQRGEPSNVICISETQAMETLNLFAAALAGANMSGTVRYVAPQPLLGIVTSMDQIPSHIVELIP